MSGLHVLPGLVVPDEELELSFSRSGGPGGQHANTSDTKVELRFDVPRSQALNDEEKRLLSARLQARLTGDGVLIVQAAEHRSQTRNREAARERLAALLAEALRERKPRRRTRPTRGAKERRLQAKRRRADIKRQRGSVRWTGT